MFQGRQAAFSQETVDKILREGFDRSQEPIAVWQDPDSKKFIVISGHSRWHASELLYKKGDKQLQTMPVKVYQGNLEQAQDYAILESNRSGTAEGLKSDLNAYKRALEKGKKRDYLLSIFKTEARVRQLEDMSYLNPKGRFIEYLGEDSEKSFPYLARNAQWVGTMRKHYTQLTNAHEREIFDYLYTGSKKAIGTKKEGFFSLVEKKATRIGFNQADPLNLNSVASSSALTASVKTLIAQVTSEIDELTSQRVKTEDNIARAKLEANEKLLNRFQETRRDLNAAILRKVESRTRLEQEMRQIDRGTLYDMFNPPPSTAPGTRAVPAAPDKTPRKQDPELLKLIARAKAVKAELQTLKL